MFPDFSQIRIFLRPGNTDMRKAINSLTVLVSEDMQGDPLSGSLYLFCNKQRKNMKVLYWDRNGFCLWQKKLEAPVPLARHGRSCPGINPGRTRYAAERN